MIDTLGLAISHGLLLLAAWRLIFRADLDDDNAPEPDRQSAAHRNFKAVLKGRNRA